MNIFSKKSLRTPLLCLAAIICLPLMSTAQVNSGSNGSDGAFNPTTSTVINMADHPTGIYQYTSVNIPTNVTVTFIPNANNTPVVWLVQSNCLIAGVVSLNGKSSTNVSGAMGGPAGYAGGKGTLEGSYGPQSGYGPGGGMMTTTGAIGGNASYGTKGAISDMTQSGARPQQPSGDIYGNSFLLPLIGGSGGSGGGGSSDGGGGGGGAILIVVSEQFLLTGTIESRGGNGFAQPIDCRMSGNGGGGSGGAIRIVTTTALGNGSLNTSGGTAGNVYCAYGCCGGNVAGSGRVRIDALSDNLNAVMTGVVVTRGFQPTITLSTNAAALTIQSIAGIAASLNPTGSPTTPDVVVPAYLANPVSVVVHCANLPVNTQIIVEVKPASGATVQAVGLNNVGTQISSTATVQMNMPRGGGVIQAKAIVSN